MSGVDERVERVREALMAHQPPHHEPPCEHGCCAPHLALDSLAAAVAGAEKSSSENYISSVVQAQRANRAEQRADDAEKALRKAEAGFESVEKLGDEMTGDETREELARLVGNMAGIAFSRGRVMAEALAAAWSASPEGAETP